MNMQREKWANNVDKDRKLTLFFIKKKLIAH